MSDKPKRWTWEEWIEYRMVDEEYVQPFAKESFEANEPYINHLEAENERMFEMLSWCYEDSENAGTNMFFKAYEKIRDKREVISEDQDERQT